LNPAPHAGHFRVFKYDCESECLWGCYALCG
jgi:hypothetical protein